MRLCYAKFDKGEHTSGMTTGDWQYYNHAWVPTCPPHQLPDLTPLEQGELFRQGGVLARYTDDYDCGKETNWWYIIKDSPFDIAALKAKHRYIVRQGEKNFEVRQIDPKQYKERIFSVAEKAFAVYPKKYRPCLNRESFYDDMALWTTGGGVVYGAFSRENDILAGYAVLHERDKYVGFDIQKTVPEYEKFQVNAALVYKILQDYAEKLNQGWYICDGARNIQHQTQFPEYLQKYFAFRKAYCKLHIVYAPKYKRLIKILYPFRRLFHVLDGIRIFHQLNGVLKMEEIVRNK